MPHCFYRSTQKNHFSIWPPVLPSLQGPLATTFPLTIRQTNLIEGKRGGGEGQKLTNHMLQGGTRHHWSSFSSVSDGIRATIAFSVVRLSGR